MKKFALAALAALVISGCQDKKGVSYGFADQDVKGKVSEVVLTEPPIANESLKPMPAPAPSVQRKIIKEGDISFETNDVTNARKRVTDALKAVGGYVSEERQANNSYEKRNEYTLDVRIPAAKFDGFLKNITSAGDRIESKNIRTRDVTAEYIDVATRLNNKKALEKRYLELLAKAGKMTDVLEIENKLNDVRTDIESSQGQLNYLNKQIDYSSLSITFYTRQSAKDNGQGFSYRWQKSIGDSWDIAVTLFFGLITLWPVWLLAVVVIYVIRKMLKRRKAKQVQQNT
ncbi:DUF4349 domain-containing protein [Mucilaginibacter sp. UR6-1]|uniref:DUF4349 domain-containing protein n=1 Tax=Mucilaginibacter sp. UR6-1 TaxID=1435643 RepID=UPI001E4609B0|nr:DUF4349 domain-containing protein [Mucilaginibacter sp. UR6-1]MCC8411155.1 DUF4349 domain-containing protein [Mucilaginibacter sp. UR6-1]